MALKKKKKSKHLNLDQILLYATSDQDLCSLGIISSNLGLTNSVEKKKKKKKKQVLSSSAFFYHAQMGFGIKDIKATFDLLDTPTAPGVLQVQFYHTCHTDGKIVRQPSLMIHVNHLFTRKNQLFTVLFVVNKYLT